VVAAVSLALKGVGYRYAGTQAPVLRGIDLELAPGRVLGVCIAGVIVLG
jgi:ABC-type bacteriocin/lantibiotic exporter with double-glycine peptidase domain